MTASKSSRTRNWLLAAGLIGAVAALVLLLRREPPWSVAITADHDEAPPWITFGLIAAMKGAPKDTSGWAFRWSVDEGSLESTLGEATWRSGAIGEHRVTLRVTSPRGTVKVATLDLQVRVGATVQQRPDVASPVAAQPPSLPASKIEITDVWVEKDEVCNGEPSTIKVKARRLGTDSDLLPIIAGHSGDTAAFTPVGYQPGLYQVRIAVYDMRHGDLQETGTFIRVKDCTHDQAMLLHAEPAPPTPDEYTLTARYFSADPGRPVEPRAKEYRWTFGDGKSAVTPTMTTRHVFPHEADRSDRYEQTYYVTLEGVDAAGEVLSRANTSVVLQNMANEMKQFGKLSLAAEYSRMPAHDAGQLTQQVTLINPDPKETANLTTIVLDFRDCSGQSREKRELSPEDIFASSTIPPRGRVSGRMVLSEADMNDRCNLHVHVAGISWPTAYEVEGSYMLSSGPGASSAQITDPQQVTALNEAVRILGKSFVTPEDIQRLEDEGKIKPGVISAPPQGPPPAPPAGFRPSLPLPQAPPGVPPPPQR